MKNGGGQDADDQQEVILIGADGFIGAAACEYLRSAGWTVHPTVFRRPPQHGEIALNVTAAGDFDALPSGLPVVNCAGLPDQSVSASLMRRVHVGGMRNLCAWAARHASPHLIQISSVSVYGNATVGTGRSERNTSRRTWNPLLASLPYGRTKARAEVRLERSGVPWSALRLPAVYGPGDSFFTRELHTLLVKGLRPLPAGGAHPVSIMPVDRIGPLLDAVLRSGPMNAARNAAGTHVPWRKILEIYAEAWEVPLVFASRRNIGNYLNFSDPGMQMAAYYAAWGAEFPDDLLRGELGWEPGGNWKDTARSAAATMKAERERIKA